MLQIQKMPGKQAIRRRMHSGSPNRARIVPTVIIKRSVAPTDHIAGDHVGDAAIINQMVQSQVTILAYRRIFCAGLDRPGNGAAGLDPAHGEPQRGCETRALAFCRHRALLESCLAAAAICGGNEKDRD